MTKYDNADHIPGHPDILDVFWFMGESENGYAHRECIYWDRAPDSYVTFGYIIKQIMKHEYRDGAVTMIAEEPQKGTVYKYNEYGDHKWYECGTTSGYV